MGVTFLNNSHLILYHSDSIRLARQFHDVVGYDIARQVASCTKTFEIEHVPYKLFYSFA